MTNSTMTTSILQERINNLIDSAIGKYYQRGIKIPERSLTITQRQGRKYIKLILKVFLLKILIIQNLKMKLVLLLQNGPQGKICLLGVSF